MTAHFSCRTKQVLDLTEKELELCRQATLNGEGSWGTMQPKLDSVRNGLDEGWATILWGAGHTFLGWALTFKGDGYDGKVDEWASYFYVPKANRRKGYGRRIHQAVHRKFGDVVVQPWDAPSRAFFDAVGARGQAAYF